MSRTTPGMFITWRHAAQCAACGLTPIAVFAVGLTGFYFTAPWYLAALVVLLFILVLTWGLIG